MNQPKNTTLFRFRVVKERRIEELKKKFNYDKFSIHEKIKSRMEVKNPKEIHDNLAFWPYFKIWNSIYNPFKIKI